MVPADRGFYPGIIMSELRRDLLHATWTILAPDRGTRPHDVTLETRPQAHVSCPFCPGNETETPPEIVASGRPAGLPADRPPWRVRVFENRYPAVSGPAGRHEVVVLSPDHAADLARLPAEHLAELLTVVQARVADLENHPELVSALFFLNSGAGAGASLSHPHGQILATPVVPTVLQTEILAHADWRRQRGGCLLCHLAGEAAGDGRLVAESPTAMAFAPHASRFAWEMLLVPRRHAARFTDASAVEIDAMATLLGRVCRALRAAAGNPAYNLVLHSTPSGVEDFHWHLELLPRLAPLAGFETGTGFHINPVRPEVAAAALRQAVQTPTEDPA
jgi:UDPglucose--hexose-1-phosphate uridylyltransferase